MQAVTSTPRRSTRSDVTLDRISKTYDKGNIHAVTDVSFSVEKGELFGLIGPDGAGKSSIFRILTTLLLPDQGSATVAGLDTAKDFRKIRGQVGYMPGRFSLYQDLTIEENLNFFATLFGTTIEENYPVIKDIYDQISPFRNRRAGKLSGGMKQKLALCCALVHKPEVLLLDEPTTGVDAVSRREFWEMLKKLKETGITILVSTPYMDEANLCDRIALIQKGRILSVDTPRQIVASFPGKLYAVKADALNKVLLGIRQYPGTVSCYAFGEWLHVSVPNPAALKKWLVQKGHDAVEIKEIEATIEDCFIRLMANEQANADRHADETPDPHSDPSNPGTSISKKNNP